MGIYVSLGTPIGTPYGGSVCPYVSLGSPAHSGGVELNEHCGPLQARPSCDPMGPYASLWGPYGDLCVPVGSPWGIYGVSMSLCGDLCVPVGSLWGFMGPYGDLWGICVSLWGIYGSLCPCGGYVCPYVSPSLQAFKARLDVALGSLGCWLGTCT